MPRVFCLLLLLWFIPSCVHAQDCNIVLKGKVLDENSVNALEDATVVIVETQQSVITDAKGRFQFKSLCTGKMSISISHIGCESQLIVLELNTDTLIKLKLNHHHHELDAVEVTASKKESHSTQSAVTIDSKELNQLSGLSLAKTLERIPGVYSLSTGATISKPVIHGLHSNRILMMNNGVRLESQQWGSEHAPEIDPFAAKKITVIKGANSLRFGSDAIGGVILVDPNPLPVKHGIAGEVNLAAFSNNAEANISATVEGCHHRVPAFSWRVNGTYKRGGNSRAPDYWLGNTGIEEGNFSVAAGYKKPKAGVEVYYSRFQTRIGILAAAHTGNLADLQAAIERRDPLIPASFTYTIGRPYQSVVHHLAKVRAYFQHKKLGDFSVTFSFQNNVRKEYDIPTAAVQDKQRPGFYFQIQTFNLDADWQHHLGKYVSGTFGISASTQTNNFKYSYFIPDFWNYGTGLFLVERWVKDKFELEGGLRFDYKAGQYFIRTTSVQYDTSLQFYAPSGNIGFEYHAKENLAWRLNFGSAFRVPAPNELFAFGVHHGAATFETGNANLRPEQSFNLSTSANYQSKYFSLNAELYTNYIRRFINLVPVQPPRLTIRGAFPSFDYRQQDALLSGSDFDFTIHPYKGLDVYNKTSLLFARNLATKNWLEQMPPLRFEYGLRYSISFSRKLKEVFAGAAVIQVLKQSLLPNQTDDYAPSPPGYWLLNFDAGVRFESKQNNYSLSVNIDNAANAKYRDYLDRFRYYADARGINCALRFTWNFFIPEHH
ncbi:MAG: TonB-dependent receptor [Bacteroidetes bacterium]|nr:TonB-dependent receptor [Bacteroidota bacterium]